MKKLISCLMVFTFLFSFGEVTNAKELSEDNKLIQLVLNKDDYEIEEYRKLFKKYITNDQNAKKIVVSEYDIYKSQLKSNKEGIDNNTFVNELYNLRKLDYSTLSKQGYSDERIEIIKNFKGTEAEMMAVSASLDVWFSGNFVSYDHAGNNEDGTNIVVMYSWDWTTHPILALTDIVGFAWTGDEQLICNEDFIDHTISYELYGSRDKYENQDAFNCDVGELEIKPGSDIWEARFPLKNPNDLTYFADEGMGSFMLNNYTYKINAAQVAMAYGHQRIGIGSPTVTKGKDLAISFTSFTDVMDSKIDTITR